MKIEWTTGINGEKERKMEEESFRKRGKPRYIKGSTEGRWKSGTLGDRETRTQQKQEENRPETSQGKIGENRKGKR